MTNDLYNSLLKQVKEGRLSPEEAVQRLKTGVQDTKEVKEDVKTGVILKSGMASKRCMQRRPRNGLNCRKAPVEAMEKVDTVQKEDVSFRENDIAVIGFSGRFPDAPDTDAFWKNLKAGKDSVRVLPEKRFHTSEFYSEDMKVPNKSYCISGGYLENVADFDAAFFNISPLEAQYMDPQSRLFLEEAWKSFEHAGYSTDKLSGTKCGVFVGCAQGDYLNYIRKQGVKLNAHVLNGYSTNMLAARISYYLNLTGKNLSIDTACSSSLVAVHEACQSILRDECDMALAGGVYVASSMDMYVMASKGGMLSKTGKCSVFDNAADGFVPSEAVGCIVLKRMEQAIKDHDSIYGVIKGSAVNYDGKTNGITAPSMLSQVALEKEVFQKSGIQPDTISYVETHGTGTKLGDPIEVNALKESFRTDTNAKGYCALGSVKSNIGHALCASGIVSMIKVLLCMNHKELVPTIHYSKLNEHIKLENTPFYINTEHKKWNSDNGPRRACVSSFGLSGTNCHVLMEEAPECIREKGTEAVRMIVLTAKSWNALKQKERDLYDWILKADRTENLADISYTLIDGRTHFMYREAFLVSTVDELKDKLQEVIEERTVENFYKKESMNCKEEIENETERLEEVLKNRTSSQSISMAEMQEIALCFVNGATLNFEELFLNEDIRRIALPVYPFEEEKYWVQEKEEKQTSVFEKINQLGKNEFSIIFKGDEFFFTEHKVNGVGIMPGAAYLELIQSCMSIVDKQFAYQIENIVFHQAFSNQLESLELRIHFYKKDSGYEFKIQSGSRELLYVEGMCTQRKQVQDSFISLQQMKENICEEKDTESCYRIHQDKGIEYQGSFRAMKKCFCHGREALAYIELPKKEEKYCLHPALLDGALQTISVLDDYTKFSGNGYLPFSIGCVSIYQALDQCAYVYTNLKEISEYALNADILILDREGQMVVKLNDVISVPFRKNQNSLVYIRSVWRERKLEQKPMEGLKGTAIVFQSERDNVKNVIEAGRVFADCAHVFYVQFGDSYKEQGNIIQIQNDCEEDYIRLFEKAGQYDENVHILYSQSKLDNLASALGKENILEYTIGNLTAMIKGIYEASIHRHVTILCLSHGENLLHAALGGFARSIMMEYKTITMKVIAYEENEMEQTLPDIIKSEFAPDEKSQVSIQYRDGARFESVLEENKVNDRNNSLPMKENGVYLISGGMGGLGQIFAEYITSDYHGTVLLLGRRPADDKIEGRLNELSGDSVNKEYIQCDVSNREQTHRTIQMLKAKYGHIDGVIHCAGVLRDALCVYKKREDIRCVLEPKILGAIHLDDELKEEKLDFFVCCSAIASIFGNTGQVDYAYANAFLDSFCEYRNVLVRDGKRFGKSVSVNWPYWEQGGMLIDEETSRKLEKRLGMKPLKTRNGINAFNQMLSMNESSQAVIEGRPEQILTSRAMQNDEFIDNNSFVNEYENKAAQTGTDEIQDYTENLLKSIIAEAIMLPVEKMKADVSFDEYGIDSLVVIDVNEKLEEKFGKLPKTLLFEYKTVHDLAGYLAKSKESELVSMMSVLQPVKSVSESSKSECTTSIPVSVPFESKSSEEQEDNGYEPGEDEIAIVGLAGRYPQASTLEQFWDNLLKGEDCITEIPRERWDCESFYNPDKDAKGKSYTKWGGFIKDADKFDAAFFHIAPREAEKMDPQERLFLETAYSAIEDAGYKKADVEGKKTGVYVGVMYNNYQLLALDEYRKNHETAINTSFSAIANRVSYFFDFRGESMAVDTMCSSSLTALYSACQSIKCGDIDSAIVGGVNLSLHFMKYLALSEGKFMSSDGRCKSFGAGGDGYVPGEGVGAIYIKPLKKALQDGDHVYALIKSAALNHGGRTNGFTVPNPNAQAEVIEDALEKAQINPRTIGVIEAHGTGTSLGDPIEIAGLTKAFNKYTTETGFCPIGSLKANIGHLESAAGIAGITKVLLEMEHKTLVPSIHSQQLNPFISFEDTPFYVQHKPEVWNRTVMKENGREVVYPLRAGISAFGAGGSNAHVILEEYVQHKHVEREETGTEVFVLSAQNGERLKEYAADMAEYLERKSSEMDDNQKKYYFHDVCYTAQIGRDAMDERLAVTAEKLQDVIEGLKMYVKGQRMDKLFTGNIHSIQEGKQSENVASAWVNGKEVDWKQIERKGCSRVSLPHYPFRKKRYWINSFETKDKKIEVIKQVETEPVLEKPLEENITKREVPQWDVLAENYAGTGVSLEIVDETIALVKMQDYEHRNSFSNEMIAGLVHVFNEIRANEQLKAVVVTGCKNVFSMGGTKEQLNNIADEKCRFSDAPFLFRGFLELDIPVISAMQGHASGGGMLFGLYADLVLMAEEGIYSATFTKYGFTPGMGATFILPERFGKLLANEMMLTAKTFTGKQLRERGASVIVKPAEKVLEEAMQLARMISEKPRTTLLVLKKEMSSRILTQLLPIIEIEEQMHRKTFTQGEVKKRIGHYYIDTKSDKFTKGKKDKEISVVEQADSEKPQNTEKHLRDVDYEKAEMPQEELTNITAKLVAIVGVILHIEEDEIADNITFRDMGVDSISGVEIIRDINHSFGLNLDAVMLYDYPTVTEMSEFIQKSIAAGGAADYKPKEDVWGERKSYAEEKENVMVPEVPLKQEDEEEQLERIESRLRVIVQDILHIEEDEINDYMTFSEMGVDSISGVEIIRDINNAYGFNLDAVVLYDYPTIPEMKKYVASLMKQENKIEQPVQISKEEKTDTSSSFFFKSSAVYGRNNGSNKVADTSLEEKEEKNSVRQLKPLKRKENAAVKQPLKKLKMVEKHEHVETVNRNHATNKIVLSHNKEQHKEPASKEEGESEKETHKKEERTESQLGNHTAMDIAIVGMSGRFPGAENIEKFWSNLKNGVNSIRKVPKDRWDADKYYSADVSAPDKSYCRNGGFLSNVEEFDPLFFHIPPIEAEYMDPQQRIFLEECWKALENAGYSDTELSNKKCGVFVGAAQGDYTKKLGKTRSLNTAEAFSGVSTSILAARISYLLNLKGPSMAIDTACSSSLVALHLACLSILNGECDMALAGGIRLMFTPSLFLQTSKMEMLSKSGNCYAFDHRADGTIMSEGCGVVVLKPLRKAIEDRDYIYGVIKGTGTNQDGKTNGITAPSAQSQSQLERDVYDRYGINPRDISYVEAHGTGTSLGDPIEVKALTDAFRNFTSDKQFCSIGSVKTNIGHATMAAGVISLIKVLLSMKHKEIPPLLNYEKANEHIHFEDSPFYVNTELAQWKTEEGRKRMAAISAFGFSGTNCHVVVEEAPDL